MKLDWRQYDIRLIAVAASLLSSVFTLLLQEIPNSDAYTYARTADIFLSDGLAAAYQHYSWASYSILIGIVSSIGLDIFSAALLVNGVFYAILVYSFLSIIREINESKSLLVLSACCILVYPQLNEYRELIIRDIGFWALSVFALWRYIVYARTHALHHAIIFSASLLAAASFRAEALAYLLFTPLALLFDTRFASSVRKVLLLRLYAVVIVLSFGLLLFLTFMGLNVARLFVEFASIYEPFVSGNYTLTEEERVLLGSLLFSDYAATFSREYIEIFLLAGMIAILFANLFTAIGAPFLIILIIGSIRSRIHLSRHIAVPVIIYLGLNLIILLGFIVLTRYLSSRYAMLMCILLALFVPLLLLQFLETARKENRNTFHYIFAIFLGYCAIDSYYSFGESKTYVRDSIEWYAENTEDSAGLVTNNHAIAYFSGKVDDYDLVMKDLSAEEILASNIGDTIAAELTFVTRQLLQRESIANKLRLLASFPDTDESRIVFFERIQ
ncbi:MAG: hypothetical protein WDZ52_03850 [Pseudohongiellaceae bacterium]